MNIFLLEPDQLGPDNRATLRNSQANHLRTVLRKRPGDSVRIGRLNGPLGIGSVLEIDSDPIQLQCAWEPEPPPRPRISLLLALPRPKVMRRLWAQLAALGVDQILLTNANKVERYYFDSHVLTPETYHPLLLEGLQQAGETHLPTVRIFKRFKPLVEDELDALAGSASRWLASPRPDRQTPGNQDDTSAILLAIGPEGGWDAGELRLLQAHDFHPFSVGPRILRSDTACIAALTLAHDRQQGASS